MNTVSDMEGKKIFPNSLRYSIIARKARWALDRKLKNEGITENDKDALKGALEFFNAAQEGRDLSSNFTLAPSSSRAISAYGELLKATIFRSATLGKPEEDIDGILSDLSSTLKSVLEGREIPSSKVERLKGVFDVIRQITMEENSTPIERTNIGGFIYG